MTRDYNKEQAWFDARLNFPVLARPDVLDKLILWREGDPRYRLDSRKRINKMQRQFTIELRVDYADQDKNEAMRKALSAAARHVLATAHLLADGVKPQIVVFSDDFFTGHEEIAILDNTLGSAIEESNAPDEVVSDELLQAARDMQHDKKQ